MHSCSRGHWLTELQLAGRPGAGDARSKSTYFLAACTSNLNYAVAIPPNPGEGAPLTLVGMRVYAFSDLHTDYPANLAW